MNLYHLKYFSDAARLSSVSKSADLNLVGQPAISKAIKSLEVSLDRDLILHERNRFQLTDEGEKVYFYSQKIFSAKKELEDSLEEFADPVGGIRFACQSSMAECSFLSKNMLALFNKYSKLQPNLMLGRTDLVKRWLLNHEIDFGIVIDNISVDEFDHYRIYAGNFVLIKSNNYRGNWKRDGVLTIEEKKEVLDLKQKFKTKYGQEMPVKMEIGSWGVIKNFVLAGVGIGFVPDYMIRHELNNKSLTIVEPKSFSFPYESLIILPKNKYISHKVKKVIQEFGVVL